jgi:hypothetical protein
MRHLLAGHGAWATGTITHLHADKKHAKVRWDDGDTIKSSFAHLEHIPDEEDDPSPDEGNAEKKEMTLEALQGLADTKGDGEGVS